MHLRVNPDPVYTLWSQYTVNTKQGAYFVHPKFREALGPLPRRCNLHVAVDGHGEYFLLLIKQPNPGKTTTSGTRLHEQQRRRQCKAGSRSPNPGTDRGWGYIFVQHKMFDPIWPTEAVCGAAGRGFPRSCRHLTQSRSDRAIQPTWVMNIPFEEVVCCDFEFYGREGNRPTVVCLVANELRSGRKFRLWQDQLPQAPLPHRQENPVCCPLCRCRDVQPFGFRLGFAG